MDYSFVQGASAIVMNEKDNVCTLIRPAAAEEVITVAVAGKTQSVQVREEIKFGHKVAIYPISQGEVVIKYGEAIGRATTNIAVGEHVHVHNIEGIRGRGDQA